MSKIAIVTDSTAYLSETLREQNNIKMVPLNVVFGDEAIQEEVEITASEFYERMKTTEKLPTTSQPAIGLYVELFEQLKRDGYEAVVCITLSSEISGTYQSAMSAADMVEDFDVRGFDSKISCSPQGYFVLEAEKLASEGKNIEEIIAHLEIMRNKINAYFMVDDLNHLHRGGRLNTAQLFVGSLLKIKPVLHFVDGKILPFEKVRTEKKALQRIYNLLDEGVAGKTNVQVTVIHSNRLSEAEKIAEELRAKYPDAEVGISYFGPVIGTHLGEGSIGISWYVA
ncbi:DegV family protein [Alkalihalobacterium chitinilyticum]|uniref:DegV family protein n=1 Tax=Alkalihalobacterium chitinilyticum TaxID=2980103 RepID=A0ABT5VEZ6_9BACI|nr:DegV family protein [Alkalihalobacterium chitinilyticum]MDE5414034.1 DegV family protein [Alkalihalobacterium chitinilyticum]